MLPGLSGRRGSGVRRRERLVLDAERRVVGSGVDLGALRDWLWLSDTLRVAAATPRPAPTAAPVATALMLDGGVDLGAVASTRFFLLTTRDFSGSGVRGVGSGSRKRGVS